MAGTPVNLALAQSLPCLHCGYDLRKMTLSGACPECGKPPGDALHGLAAARPGDVEAVRGGVGVLLGTSLVVPVIVLSTLGIVLLGGFRSGPPEALAYLVGFAVCICTVIVTWAGMCRVSSAIAPAAPPVAASPLSSLDVTGSMRWVAAASCVCSIGWYVSIVVLTNLSNPGEGVVAVMALFLTSSAIAWTAKNALASTHLAGLMRRTNARGLSRVLLGLAWFAALMGVAAALAGCVALAIWAGERWAKQWADEWVEPLMRGPFLLGIVLYIAAWAAMIVWHVAWPAALFLVHRRLRGVATLSASFQGPLMMEVVDASGGAAEIQGQKPQAPSPPVL